MAGMANPRKPATGRGALMLRIAALHAKVSQSKAVEQRVKLRQQIAALTQQIAR
jgi:hypothetical protein